jgi:5'-phosphate synthase pdxT subunit
MGVGVLALQGDFAAHAAVLRRLGESVREVRSWADLADLRALVLPGGESTALLRLMDGGPWFDALRAFHDGGGALLGTCAGAILLARDVDPAQPSLGLLDVSISRNAYGRQVDSFESTLDAPAFDDPLLGVFIRAPRFTAVGPRVEVLGRLDGEPVLVRHGRVLAATFHPEIAGDDRVHRMLIER